MPDLLKILRLPLVCDGGGKEYHSNKHKADLKSAANTTGSVFFSAPLYRPNLHYKVLSKPASSKTAIEAIGKWIKDNHQFAR